MSRRVTPRSPVSAVPLLSGARRLADIDVFPGGSRENLNAAAAQIDSSAISAADALLMADAQTSGGLLAAVAPEQAQAICRDLNTAGCRDVARIGVVREGRARVRLVQ